VTTCDNILAIRELIVHNAELAAEAAALPATATDLNDISAASSSTSEQLQSSQTGYVEGEAEASMATTKKPRMIFASYSQKLESSLSALLRTVAIELEDYLSLPRLQPSADVLAFWKSNRGKYPQLARATSGIPSGSASAESVLSRWLDNECSSSLYATTDAGKINLSES
jgi:hAT family C-terminal dimerisation region